MISSVIERHEQEPYDPGMWSCYPPRQGGYRCSPSRGPMFQTRRFLHPTNVEPLGAHDENPSTDISHPCRHHLITHALRASQMGQTLQRRITCSGRKRSHQPWPRRTTASVLSRTGEKLENRRRNRGVRQRHRPRKRNIFPNVRPLSNSRSIFLGTTDARTVLSLRGQPRDPARSRPGKLWTRFQQRKPSTPTIRTA